MDKSLDDLLPTGSFEYIITALTSTRARHRVRSMDANWFLAACAQTAGAIVAVVGGFVATRLVSQSSEADGLKGRHTEIGRSLAALRLEEQDAGQALDDFFKDRFREQAISALIETGEREPNFEALFVRFSHEVGNLPEESCRREFERLREDVQAAQVFLNERVPRDCYAELDEVVDGRELQGTGIARDALEAVFGHFARSRQQFPIFGNVVETTARQQMAFQQRLRLQEQLHSLSSSADRLEGTQREIENRLSELGRPRGLARIFTPLCYLAVFGILAPLLLLLIDEGNLPIGVPAVVLSLFAIGVLWMLLSFLFERRSLDATSFLEAQRRQMHEWQSKHGIPWSRRRYEPPDTTP